MGSMSLRERARGRFVMHRERRDTHVGIGSLLGFGLCQVEVGCGRDWERAGGETAGPGERMKERERERVFSFSKFFFLFCFQNQNQIQIEFKIHFSIQIKMRNFGKFSKNNFYNFLKFFYF